ncbi:MAG: glycosyltransferase family 2 protein [Bacteroidota bacterium]|nr:glycosyltransferase family 2 protein [Bacteroidota bacterium]
MKKVSILIPVYNEESTLILLFNRLVVLMDNVKEYEWEVLLVNDGSNDNSLLLMSQMYGKDNRFNYLDLSRNYGKETAMLAGFDYITGDCMVIMDADLQHPPEIIPEMIRYWEEGYDDVYAKRRVRGGESYFKRKTARWFYKLLQKLTPIPIQQDTGDFRLLDKICINALRSLRESQRYTKGMFCWIGFNKKEILFDQQERVAGETKWSNLKLLNLAIEGITSFTTKPLRMSSVVGVFVSSGAFIYMIYVFVRALLFGDPVQGYPTLMVVILFLGGVQLLSLGVIGEYLGRVFYETKNRPPYFARLYNGKKTD